MDIPKDKAPKKDFDKLYKKHLPLAEGALTLLVPEQAEYYKTKLTKAMQRAKFLKNVPNQARWFIKLQEGISDVLKAKCAPRNLSTVKVVKECYKKLMLRKLQIEKKVIVAAHNYPIDGGDGPTVPFTFKKFAEAYNEFVETFDDFQQELRADYKEAVRHEKVAFALLKKYLEDKELVKNAPPSDYKAFKAIYLKMAKDLT